MGESAGTVLVTGGGVYTVELEDGRRVEAFLRGRLKKEDRGGADRVVVGDRVTLSFEEGGTEEGGAAVIEGVLERRSLLARRGRSPDRPRVVAANVDRLVVVMSVARPRLRRDLLDRFLVLAEACDVEPFVVLNKIDLLGGGTDRPPEERPELRELGPLREVYHRAGYRTLPTSARDGSGIEALREELSGRLSAFAGPSGVGKSELLNALDPALRRRTGPVSAKGRRGRHTTVNARLLDVRGDARVVDTPGFTDTGLWNVAPDELPLCFPEFRHLQLECRFRGGCTHLHEPGCVVREALEEGALDPGRYESYVTLRGELEGGDR